MKKTRKRLKFKCWQCDRTFSLMKEFTGAPKLIVTCPFCGAACIADLAAFSLKTVEVVRNDSAAPGTVVELDLPEVIPTTQAGDEETG